ncbi:hypothetical protein DFP72DRAFT_1048783 [Ephemerocybe angulata]|uniref:Uncharacterized protein n=1 Tax=Ephemerocybe angulata TaxID=980116 RepID=A0A8H6HP44_9AGAR|nr:hypothetical protein DFP72DRAFT_1048783 [Tulosesus angulatus]
MPSIRINIMALPYPARRSESLQKQFPVIKVVGTGDTYIVPRPGRYGMLIITLISADISTSPRIRRVLGRRDLRKAMASLATEMAQYDKNRRLAYLNIAGTIQLAKDELHDLSTFLRLRNQATESADVSVPESFQEHGLAEGAMHQDGGLRDDVRGAGAVVLRSRTQGTSVGSFASDLSSYHSDGELWENYELGRSEMGTKTWASTVNPSFHSFGTSKFANCASPSVSASPASASTSHIPSGKERQAYRISPSPSPLSINPSAKHDEHAPTPINLMHMLQINEIQHQLSDLSDSQLTIVHLLEDETLKMADQLKQYASQGQLVARLAQVEESIQSLTEVSLLGHRRAPPQIQQFFSKPSKKVM